MSGEHIQDLENRWLLNSAPVAKDDVLAIKPGTTSASILPLANDKDADGDTLTIQSFTNPARGTVTKQGNTIVYVPGTTYQGFDSLTYVVADPSGAQATGKITIASGVAMLQGDWSTAGANAARTGYKSGYLGAAEPIAGWSLAKSTTAGWGVTIGGGKAYVTQNATQQKIRALLPKDGSQIWEVSRAAGQLSDSIEQPTFYNDRIYVRSGAHSDSKMLALRAADGSTVWQAANSTQWDRYVAPAVADIGVWSGGGYYGGMQGWNLATGSQIIFVYGPQEDGWGTAIDGQNVFRVLGGQLYKYSSAGAQLWNVAVSNSGDVPVLGDGKVFLASSAGMTAINQSNGTTAWTAGGAFSGNAALGNGVVYAISGRTIKSMNASTGTALRTFTATENLAGQPIVTDDAMLISGTDNTFVFSLATGDLLSTLAGAGKISLADNRLYIAKSEGSVQTYAIASEENAWPVAEPDTASVAEEGTVAIDVVANDHDPDAQDKVTLQSISGATHGVVSIESGKVIYAPAKDYFGPDLFTYVAIDERSGKATGTVSVTMAPVNDPPVATPATFYVPTNGPSGITLAGTDVDGDALTFNVIALPHEDVLSGTGPNFTFTPNPHALGSEASVSR